MTEDLVYDECSFDGCSDPAHAGVMCHAHSKQLSRTGIMRPKRAAMHPTDTFCEVSDCSRVEYARNLCSGHYQQDKNGAPLTYLPPLNYSECCEDECTRVAQTSGRCRPHYAKWRRSDRPECNFAECDRAQDARGYCSAHVQQLRAGKELTPVRLSVPGGRRPKCLDGRCNRMGYGNSGLCLVHDNRRRKYGLTLTKYLELPTSCEVCGGDDRLTVDHDHGCCSGGKSCGKCVRGVLCASCNHALGNVRDSVDTLNGLIRYLSSKMVHLDNQDVRKD